MRLNAIGRDFGSTKALENISLEVRPGEFVCIVGASGSGKSTLLSLIAGLDAPSTGTITVDGARVHGPGPERGLVFQTGALFPWKTVGENVAFGLRLLRLNRAERRDRVAWYLAEVGLRGLEGRLPKELSGGQRQRVAIARALVCEPSVLLLDEPFGALDCQTKDDMQVFLRQVWKDTGTTILMVTHDVEEAVFLAQRVIVLTTKPGRIAAELDVDLPGHRDLLLKREPDFLKIRAEVDDLVRAHM
ncbi:ABC transporter ATP-binding protein [Actinocorallia longicatena]|uniref:ABC transporter ATP-binding protein n=1 Tax=Actinocorallia longicatena TaxID=111803 RepID=A0ABP6Q5M4_9ACTN